MRLRVYFNLLNLYKRRTTHGPIWQVAFKLRKRMKNSPSFAHVLKNPEHGCTMKNTSYIFVYFSAGIFLVVTPDYLIDRKTFPYPSGLAGEIYCRLIGSTYILYIFGKASTSTIMCLAIDRWYSIVKPIRYKTAFSKRRLYLYITLIWASAAITQINELFITAVEDGLCTFKIPFYGQKAERILILIHVIVTFYIPSIVTWVTFGHIWIHMRQPNIRRHLNNNKATKRLLRMCALAAFFLTMSWLPAETFFILFKFEILILPFEFYLSTTILAMSNSCFNPWIYCLSNREYRKEFVRLLCCIHLDNPRIKIRWLDLIRKRRLCNSSYSFSPEQTSSNRLQVDDGAQVLRLRTMTSNSSFNSVKSHENMACSSSELNKVQEAPGSHTVISKYNDSATSHF